MNSPEQTADELLAQLTACLEGVGPDKLAHLEGLLTSIAPGAYGAVDASLRSQYPWPKLSPRDVTPSWFRKVPWPVAAVAASHHSGYVRQAAIRTLSQSGRGRALTQIVVRLNDWVPEVRRAAEAALAAFMSPEYASDLVQVLPTILALSKQKRADQAVVTSWLLNMLERDACRSALTAGFFHESRGTRLACLQTAIKNPSEDLRCETLQAALRDRDPFVRVWGARSLERELPHAWALELAHNSLTDASVQVRRIILPMLLGVLPWEKSVSLCEAALLERSASARWHARQLRLRLGPLDLRDFYRGKIASAATTPDLRGALLGLGESGKKEDIALVERFLKGQPLAVRVAALTSLAGLHDLTTTDPFIEALSSFEPAVSRAGRLALEARHRSLPFVQLGKLAEDEGVPRHVRLNSLSLANRAGKWERLPILLGVYTAADTEVFQRALRYLQVWLDRYNQSFLQPTATQIADAAKALKTIPEGGERLLADIRHIVKTMSG